MRLTQDSQLPVHARLVQPLPALDACVYLVEPPAGPLHWLVVDGEGKARGITSAELLLLARMRLDELDALRRPGRHRAPRHSRPRPAACGA